jgi:murein L,D-transpeptidase YcbB/YkuD
VFIAELQSVIFRPFWNIPMSILRNETIPAIRKDPGYLAREGMEIVAGPSDDSPVLPPTAENIARLGVGGVRLRQRPGPRNALGRIKFLFPNSNDVYMHDTPATQLFGRPRRDFSHGCIRVADPAGLAAWVLSGLPEWTTERIGEAMQGSPNHRVELDRPVPVVIYYTTAGVAPDDGRVHFADDIYGQDRPLDRALGGSPR